MQQTLLIIPHWFVAGPLMWVWLGLMLVGFVWSCRRHSWKESLTSNLPLALGGVVVIRWILPQVEVLGLNPADPDGPLVAAGLAIRGYGLFLMLGILVGILACVVRGKQIGIRSEQMISLCVWLVVLGLVGARLFYVIQKWETYRGESGPQLLLSLLDMTEGGLVVFGGLFGALAAWLLYCWWQRLPALPVADILAPAMLFGLCLGRLGCLMNGCCYGEVCSADFGGIRFPAGSAPYYRHVETGELLGMRLQAVPEGAADRPIRKVVEVIPGSVADRFGIASGDRVTGIGMPPDVYVRGIKTEHLRIQSPAHANLAVEVQGKPLILIPIQELPDWSLPVYATQIFSSIDAFLLGMVLWCYFPFRRAQGELLALMLILYSVSRFLMEIVRGDELGVAGTQFSISQWVGILVLPVGLALWFALRWGARRGLPGVAVTAGPALGSPR